MLNSISSGKVPDLGPYQSIVPYIEKLGDITTSMPCLISAGLSLYEGDYASFASLGLIALAQVAEIAFMKHFNPKMRPNEEDNRSFPSGHAAGAFLGVGCLAAKYGFCNATNISIPIALTVSFSRWITKKHWPLDVFAGGSLGLLNGTLAIITPPLIGQILGGREK